jgi:DNA-binding response OmpR family regulator
VSLSVVPVLVVDDHFDTADSTVILLASHGYDARPAYSCADAIEAVANFRPAVVVLDLNLSDGTGYALVGRLERALGYRPAFVVVTGVRGLEGHSRGVGLTSHLVKPVPPHVLLDAIRRLPLREVSRHASPDAVA